jgi:hypothetical protein
MGKKVKFAKGKGGGDEYSYEVSLDEYLLTSLEYGDATFFWNGMILKIVCNCFFSWCNFISSKFSLNYLSFIIKLCGLCEIIVWNL